MKNPNLFYTFFYFQLQKAKDDAEEAYNSISEAAKKEVNKMILKKPFVLLRLLAYSLAGNFWMPRLPGCISWFVLQADHPVVSLLVRHMSNNNMNICAIFMLKPEYQKISIYHTS